MGFPLSTDIFGQLKWLVKQVKLLVFRVTRIEQGGGGGAQNINQVLTTGATATNKTLLFNDTTGLGTTAELSSTRLRFINTDDAFTSTIGADGISFESGNALQITADIGIILQGAGGLGSLFLNIEPNLFEVTRVLGGSIETGLSLDFDTNVFNFGDIENSAGLLMNVSTGEYFLGNQDGTYFRVNDADTGSFIVTAFPNGGESGLGLFNNLGHYLLGDFGETAQPDSYNVYLDVSSNKTNASIKSYYQGTNQGLYIDHNADIYGFRNEQNNNAYFGIGLSSLTGFPSLVMSNGIALSAATALSGSFIPINISGIMYYIPLYL